MRRFTALVLAVVLVSVGFVLGRASDDPVQIASADEKASPSKGAKARDVYYPGTEDLGPSEMRIVCCGTGMPSARPKQAAACFLCELGNGDKFLFDIGSGSHERIAAQKIPYDEIDKVFISHLHVDHYGDLASFWLGGTVMNRLTPLRIWGPSGSEKKYGTARALALMEEMYAWDIATRSGFIDARGMELRVTEFPYSQENKVVYQENGVTIRSIPAIHGLDGSVMFILEWKGLKFVYGGDSVPSKWLRDHGKGADLVIHECMIPPTLYVEKQGFAPAEALAVATQLHTSPEQFGKMMSMIGPRHAVAYHFYNDFDTAPDIRQRIKKTYDGEISLAMDYMVFNVTKEKIRVRMSAVDEEVWPSPAQKEKIAPDSSGVPISDFVNSGRISMPDVVGPIYEEINKLYGTDIKPPK